MIIGYLDPWGRYLGIASWHCRLVFLGAHDDWALAPSGP